MHLTILLFSIALLIFLIIKKINPVLALLGVSIISGLLFSMPIAKLISSISTGIGSTLSSTAMVIGIGAIIGTIAEESGAAQKLVYIFTKWFGQKNIQWAVLCTGLLAGIPLFYNAGFVVLIPIVFAIAKSNGLPLLYAGLPMAASLSVTHGFLPPHPGPVALASLFNASIGKTLLYGLIIAAPIAAIAGVAYARLVVKKKDTIATVLSDTETADKALPSSIKSFIVLLSPVLLIAIGTAGSQFTTGILQQVFMFLQEPLFALLLSLTIALIVLHISPAKAAHYTSEGIKAVALIVFVIAAGGAFKQILVDSKTGEQLKLLTAGIHLSPLFLGWTIAAIFRIALGSATVAAITASGIVAPLITAGVSPELMVLAVGAGSIFCSHVNDTGFWMFKEYFGLSIKQTFKTWTVMESLISVLGLLGVLLLNNFIS